METPGPQISFLNKLRRYAGREIEINEVKVVGNTKTKEDLILKYISPVYKAKTLEDVIQFLQSDLENLHNLGIFKSVRILLEPDVLGRNIKGDPLCNLVVSVKEKSTRRMSHSVKTAPDHLALWESQLTFANLFGRCETLNLNFQIDNKANNTMQLLFSKPLLLWAEDRKLEINLFKQTLASPKSLFTEKDKGGIFRYYQGNHEFSYEGNWRNISADPKASFSVYQYAGDSFKSSVKHSYKWDSRDDPLLPTTGYFIKSTAELAGLGGDVKFFRHDLEGQFNCKIGKGWAINWSLHGGVVLPLWGDQVRINDKCFLGGPVSVRGFRTKGLGPATKNESLGGDVYFAANTHLMSPAFSITKSAIPIQIKAQLFHNCGNLVNLENNTKSTLAKLFGEEIRSSVGAGIVVKTPIGFRVEFNFAYPLRTFGYDKFRFWVIGFSTQF